MALPDDPLHCAQQEALVLLSRLILFLWTPIFAFGILLRWSEADQRALFVLILTGVPLLGGALRLQRWSVERRAWIAILMIMGMSLPAMVMNGPRTLSTMAVALVMMLALMFFRMQTAIVILGVYLAATIAGLWLASQGLITPGPPDTALSMRYRVITLGVTFSGLWFSARVLQRTVQIYREAQAAAEQRQEAMLEAQREAELLQRRELVNTVTTGLTHDLANVVQVMTSTAELLEEEPLREEAQQSVKDLQRVGNEAALRLRTILSVGRPRSDFEQQASIDELFARLDLLLRPILGRRIQLTLHADAALPLLAIDRGRLEQILLNLAINARDAMPEGGTLRIEAKAAQGGAAIDVADSGVGIDPKLQTRIWEPFYTTKSAERGTGLGLAMVSRILESTGGRVQLTSALGVGTTFSLWLPAVTATL
ncbi:ATP-binding protein [Gemmatimonas sp.]|uniref:sensor histidine kinase n=1 Tax=Gemmatimonas sp. TaxID=1962908 RepID=UPI003340EDD2